MLQSMQKGLMLSSAAVLTLAVLAFAVEPAKPVAGPGDLRLVKKAPVVEAEAATPPQADADASLLEDTVRQTQLERQVLVAEVTRELARSRDMMSVDPRGVLINMRALEERVRRSAALTPDVRANLHKQIEAVVTRAVVRTDEKERQEILVRGKKGEADQVLHMLDRLGQKQVKIKTYMDRFDALMAEGKYVEAEEAQAVEVRALDPSSTLGVSANLIARTVGYHMANMAVRESTQRGAMDELALCAKSHIPFPDDQPIVYPDAKTWAALSKSRKKFASVDMKKAGGAEEKIINALDEPTQLEFIETPLAEVIDYLKDLHGIEIQLDQKALDAAGVAIDIPVTRNLKGVTLRSALRLMLKQLDLTYVIQNEVLMITSSEEAANKLITKVYPVADLVLPIKDTGFTGGFGGQTGGLGGQGIGGGNGTQQGGFGGGGQGGGGFGGGGGFN